MNMSIMPELDPGAKLADEVAVHRTCPHDPPVHKGTWTAAYEQSRADGFYGTNPGTDTAILQLSLNQPTANSKGLRYGNFVQIRDIINEELEAIWAGDKSAQEGFDTSVERGANGRERAFGLQTEVDPLGNLGHEYGGL